MERKIILAVCIVGILISTWFIYATFSELEDRVTGLIQERTTLQADKNMFEFVWDAAHEQYLSHVGEGRCGPLRLEESCEVCRRVFATIAIRED